MNWIIPKCKKGLRGRVNCPADKSISHRAIMFGSLSKGEVVISNFLFGEDCLSTCNAFKAMGVDILRDGKNLIIRAKGLRGLRPPGEELYLGNSGTTMRIIAGILAGQEFDSILTGDTSLSSRPMDRIIKPLKMMGAQISDLGGAGHAPLSIKGRQKPLSPIDYSLPVASAQVKSCVLAAGLYANGQTSVSEPFQSRDHTERMLKYFGADIFKKNLRVTLSAGEELQSKNINVPGDISSAAFFIIAALLVPGSEVIISDVGLNPTRTGLIDVLKRMGASIEILNYKDNYEPTGDLKIKYSILKNTVIENKEIPLLIDEVPIIMLAALCAEGITEIKGVEELKLKESDRISAMKKNIDLLGGKIDEKYNTVFIEGGEQVFSSADLESFGDHRIAMSMAVAALLSDKQCSINDVSCVDTSYPGFYDDLIKLFV